METFSFRMTPFGLCNAPATFQSCMMSMFSDLVEEAMEIFMDDFSVYDPVLKIVWKIWKQYFRGVKTRI